MTPTPGVYRHQDGQVLFAPGDDKEPHPEWRWRRRAPGQWRDANLLAMWRTAEPVDHPAATPEAYCRYHEPSRMVLIAEYGCISTAVPLWHYPESTQSHILDQIRP